MYGADGAAALMPSRYSANLVELFTYADKYCAAVGILNSCRGLAQSFSTVADASTTADSSMIDSFCVGISLFNSISGSVSGILAATSVITAPLKAGCETTESSLKLACSITITPFLS